MNPIIETKGLTHIYSQGTPFRHVALEQVNFSAAPGEFMGIIGHTGSGKSTLIQHLNGLRSPQRDRFFSTERTSGRTSTIRARSVFRWDLYFSIRNISFLRRPYIRTLPLAPAT